MLVFIGAIGTLLLMFYLRYKWDSYVLNNGICRKNGTKWIIKYNGAGMFPSYDMTDELGNYHYFVDCPFINYDQYASK